MVSSYYTSWSSSNNPIDRGRTSSRYNAESSGFSSGVSMRRPRDLSLGSSLGKRESYAFGQRSSGYGGIGSSSYGTSSYTSPSGLMNNTNIYSNLDSSWSKKYGSNPDLLSNRHSTSFLSSTGLGSETAKYNREEAMKEIHSNFLKEYNNSQKKYGLDVTNDDDYKNRLNKARNNFLQDGSSYLPGKKSSSNTNTYSSTKSYLDDRATKKECLGDMFASRNKYSNRTVNAVNYLLENDGSKKRKEDYKWRKDFEEFEKNSKYEKDQKIRDIRSRRRRDLDDRDETENNYSNRFSSSSRFSVTPSRSIYSKDETKRPSVLRELNDSESFLESISRPKTSWRDRFGEDELNYEDRRQLRSVSVARLDNEKLGNRLTNDNRGDIIKSWRERLGKTEAEESATPYSLDQGARSTKISWKDDIDDSYTTKSAKKLLGDDDLSSSYERRTPLRSLSSRNEDTSEVKTPSWRERLNLTEFEDKKTPYSFDQGTKNSSWKDEIDGNYTSKSVKKLLGDDDLSSSYEHRTPLRSLSSRNEDTSEVKTPSWRERLNLTEFEDKKTSYSFDQGTKNSSWKDEIDGNYTSKSVKKLLGDDDLSSSYERRTPLRSLSSRNEDTPEVKTPSWRERLSMERTGLDSGKAPQPLTDPPYSSKKSNDSKMSFAEPQDFSRSASQVRGNKRTSATSLNSSFTKSIPNRVNVIPEEQENDDDTLDSKSEEKNASRASEAAETEAAIDKKHSAVKVVKKGRRVLKTQAEKDEEEAKKQEQRRKSVLIVLPETAEEKLKKNRQEPKWKKKHKAQSQAKDDTPKDNHDETAGEKVKPVADEQEQEESKDEDSKESEKKDDDNIKGEQKEEEEDAFGTKQIKSDFDARMAQMEQEMMAGQSKLAKLRERIRRAKGVIKDADAAVANAGAK